MYVKPSTTLTYSLVAAIYLIIISISWFPHLDVPLFYVHGNHDGNPQYATGRGQLKGVQGGKDLHAATVNYGDLLMAGLGGFDALPFRRTVICSPRMR